MTELENVLSNALNKLVDEDITEKIKCIQSMARGLILSVKKMIMGLQDGHVKK